MLKKIVYILQIILFTQGIVQSQTNESSSITSYTLGFSTYLSHTDKYAANFDIYTDNEGYTYYSGCTRDKNFPATKGAFQTELKGEADAFVAKFAPDGKIVFATLIGGAKREHHTAITVDKLGYIYVVGGTHSSDFPVTQDAYDTSFNGEGEWAGDVYVLKLNTLGNKIVFASYIGGKVEETVSAGNIKIDSKGNIVIAGTTLSSDFPVTEGVIHNKFTKQACFISKLSPNGDKLLFSTSLGNGVYEMVTGLAIDGKDNIYLTGYNFNAELPITANAIRKNMIRPVVAAGEAGIDHFLAKINENGTKILYLSYYAAGGHMGTELTWTSPNRLMITGSVNEEGFPVTEKAIYEKSNGEKDCFISVFNSEDMTILYSSFFGGREFDQIESAHFLNKDTIVIGGITNSPDFPFTDNALFKDYPNWESTFNNTFFGRRKSFVSVIDIKNGKLLYSTYLGGCFHFKICPDKVGNISFIGEAGQREAYGMTGFPVVGSDSEEPPTYLMLGRLVLNNISIKK
ncbi:MAG: hypothetical protein A2W99_07480 [Bacteroidetes bacterium GWF2_33_16]|nr:MAG: hypothetical protein A2X00_10430 [Bacteroidetes bacterium GWE2_32_14]OFY03049.1 MAG: hypothetical protein A2W99_07480 [Bacteroidetes bacterium GWF2_33_16]